MDYYESLIPVDDIFEWIKDTYDPVDVFGETQMNSWAEDWAKDNGYKLCSS